MQQLPSEMRLHFLDVGQGDALLLEYGDRFAMVDCGRDSMGLSDTLEARKVDTLDWIVLSHMDRDHFGGCLPLLQNRFPVKQVFLGPDSRASWLGDSLRNLLNQGEKDTFFALDTLLRGQGIALDTGFTLEALWPPPGIRREGNDASLVLALENRVDGALHSRVLLMGDLESEGELELLQKERELQASLLKVGHHGSQTASSMAMLGKIAPEYAVISVGKNNSYGHPHRHVIQRLESVQAQIVRTDSLGTISFEWIAGFGLQPQWN